MMGMPAEFGYNYTTIDNPNQLQYAPKGAKFYKGSKSYFVRNPNGDLWLERDGNPTTFNSEKDAKKFIEWMAEQDKRAEGLPKLSGLDLKVGGEWARNLYDKSIVNFMNRYGKKWGAKVEDIQLGSPDRYVVEHNPNYEKEQWHVIETKPSRKLLGTFKNQDTAKAYMRDMQKNEPKVHAVPITPEMKRSVMQGQPISKNEAPSFDWTKSVNRLARPQVA